MNFISYALITLLSLSALFSNNALDSILNYRLGFSAYNSDVSIGIQITPDSSTLSFVSKYIISIAFQIFGLYINNLYTLALFLSESLLFIGCIIFIIKQSGKYQDKFISFLLMFVIFYSCIWALGNDNIGTALRLRIYTYVPIYIAFTLIINMRKSLAASLIEDRTYRIV